MRWLNIELIALYSCSQHKKENRGEVNKNKMSSLLRRWIRLIWFKRLRSNSQIKNQTLILTSSPITQQQDSLPALHTGPCPIPGSPLGHLTLCCSLEQWCDGSRRCCCLGCQFDCYCSCFGAHVISTKLPWKALRSFVLSRDCFKVFAPIRVKRWELYKTVCAISKTEAATW